MSEAAGAIAPVSDVQEAPSPGASASFTGTKHKVKVDDSELEVEYDELVRGYQKGRAANERFQRASEMQKAVNGFIERARQGDLDWIDDVGVPDEQARKWAEKRLLKHIEYEQMTPEQKELMRLRREKETLTQEREREKQERAQIDAQAAEQRAFKEIDDEISAAIAALGKKASPRLVRRMAEQMMASLSDEDGARIPADKAAQQAYRGLVTDAESLLSEMAPADVLTLLERAGKRDLVRKAFVNEAVAQAPSRAGSQASPAESPRQPGKLKRMTTDEWFTRLEKRAKR